jgi:hypothetical protein
LVNVFFCGYGQWTYVSDWGNPDSYNFDLPLNDFACGVFKLNEKDEIAYKYTKSLESVTHLLACTTHSDSEFSRRLRDRMLCIIETQGYITMEDAEHCSFKIDQSKENTLIIVEPSAEVKKQKTDISETERQTMLKLIIGMAIDGYGYDLTDPKSPLTGGTSAGLSARLALKGIAISDDTIRKYFNEAKYSIYQEAQ